MDPVTLSFYALVCGLLAGFVPTGVGRVVRLVIGVAVGLVAAALLPSLRTALGL